MRLQKYLAQAGVCSRRKAEEYIQSGQITVNGKPAVLGMSVKDDDRVKYLNQVVTLKNKKIYLALNKPVGYITSRSSAQGQSVMDLIQIKERVYPVGRLDKDSQGLLILTNDGELANHLTHPKYGSDKEYVVELDQPLLKPDIDKLQQGMTLNGKRLQPVKVSGIRGKTAQLILHEGINRQIRRMLGKLGYKVVKLKRIRISRLQLNDLKPGKWRYIQKKDILL